MLCLQAVDLIGHGFLGQILEPRIEGRVDVDAVVQTRPKLRRRVQLVDNVSDELRVAKSSRGRGKVPTGGFPHGGRDLCMRREITVNAHKVENLSHAGQRRRSVQDGVVDARSARQAGEKCRLGEVETADLLPEIDGRGRLGTDCLIAVADTIEVIPENLSL